MEKDLSALRREIDELDQKIVGLLNRRAECASAIGDLKRETKAPVYVPKREREVLQRVTGLNQGPLSDDCIRSVYRELMSGSLVLEKDFRVSFLGPPGTFSYLAARSKFGDQVSYRPDRDVEEIFENVARGNTDYGVVPCENSLGSGINLSLDLFLKYDVQICAEVFLTVELDLLSKSPLEEITAIYSHPHAFRQCSRWLRSQFPDADLVEVRSTTEGARKASITPHSAAIAHSSAAQTYRLERVCENIQDDPRNFTRFFVLAQESGGDSGSDRTSLVIGLPDRVGALCECLEVFERRGISLTKIESRMVTSRAREVLFYVDLRGHASDPKVRETLGELKGRTTVLRVLGSYPAHG